MNKKACMAYMQMLILTLAIVAFAFIINSTFISAQEDGEIIERDLENENRGLRLAAGATTYVGVGGGKGVLDAGKSTLSLMKTATSGGVWSKVGGVIKTSAKEVGNFIWNPRLMPSASTGTTEVAKSGYNIIEGGKVIGQASDLASADALVTSQNEVTSLLYGEATDVQVVEAATGKTIPIASPDKVLVKDIFVGDKIGGAEVAKIETLKDGNIQFFDSGKDYIGNPAKPTDTLSQAGVQGNHIQVADRPGLWAGQIRPVIVGFVWSTAAYYATNFIGGLIDKDGRYSLEISAVASGVSTYVGIQSSAAAAKATLTAVQAGEKIPSIFSVIGSGGKGALTFSWGALWFGLAVAAITYLLSEEKEVKQETIQFKCMSWQAPTGGEDCELCNDQDVPCSEYRCKSLGQGCGIINAGTGDEKCIWMNPRDAASPGIKPLQDVLTAGYEYAEVKERPEGRSGGASGMRIVKAGGGCIDAFTAIEFGVEASEPAQCKIEYQRTEGFEEMAFFMNENNLFQKEHTQKVSLPGTELLNSLDPESQNDGEYTLYIRCRDGNGNENVDEFVVGFCVDKGPDLTPPIIKETSIKNNVPVQYNIDNLSIATYTNEPASCKWDRKDASYDNMQNQMDCSNEIWQMNAELLYTCTTTLTGIKDQQDNDFYFRCQDLANNSMRQSHKLTLKGSQPLNILKVGPNGTIGGSTSTVTVTLTATTDNGADNGVSTCSYSESGTQGSYIQFFETNANTHKQDLDLITGDYRFSILCIDAGGNTDSRNLSFNVLVDTEIPSIIRAYEENDKLKVVTNEDSECRFSSESCNYDFEEGILMVQGGEDSTSHYAEWRTGQNYFIKCSDQYDNFPAGNICSIIVRPSSV